MAEWQNRDRPFIYTTELHRRHQRQPNAHISQNIAADQPSCFLCSKFDLTTVFVGKCCRQRYLCEDCYFRSIDASFYFDCCRQTLYKAAFRYKNITPYLEPISPKCDSCNQDEKLEYILPCDHLICKTCFEDGTFTRNVKCSLKAQLFISCSKHGSLKKLFPIQRVHTVAIGSSNSYQGLACVVCHQRLQGNCYGLKCEHFACMQCYSRAYCSICREMSVKSNIAEIRGIQHHDLLNRKVALNEECMETKLHTFENKCTIHFKMCVRITCGTSLCAECINEMAERKVSVMDGRNETEEHCICKCEPIRGKHIISVKALKMAISQIEYLKEMQYGCCSRCSKDAIVKFRQCGDKLCFECVSERLRSNVFIKSQHNKISGNQVFLVCGTNGCDAMIPVEQLDSLIKKLVNRETDIEIFKEGMCSYHMCRNRSFIKLLKCHHKICRSCLEMIERESTEGVFICGVYDCKNMFRQGHLNEFLQEEREKDISSKARKTTTGLHQEHQATSSLMSTVTGKGISLPNITADVLSDEGRSSGTDDYKNCLMEQPSNKDTRRFSAGNSSNLRDQQKTNAADKPTEQTYELDKAPSGIGKQSTLGSSVNKESQLSRLPPMNEDQEMMDTTTFDEPVESMSTTTSSDIDSEKWSNEFLPSKKRSKGYLKEKPCLRSCSLAKNHGEVIIEFNDCGHGMCEHCVYRKLSRGYPSVFCGIRKGSTIPCPTKIPIEVVAKYLQDRTTTNREKIHFEDSSMFPCSKMFCSKRAVVHFTECDHRMCIDCMIELSSNQETDNPTICGIGKITLCKTVIPMQPVNEYIDSIKNKTSFYIKDNPRGKSCSKLSCSKKAAVEFRKCSHLMCEDCVFEKVSNGKIICGIGFRTCQTEIPTEIVNEYLLNYAGKDMERTATRYDMTVCDNPVCTAESLLKTKIRKTFPCKHKLCIICVSAQQTREDDVIVCKACAHSKITQTDPEIAGIPNVGLTCYAGCVLQVLGQTPGFEDILCKYSQESEQDDVETLLKKLLELVNVGSAREYFVNWTLMQRLMRKIFQIDRSFRQYQENDCHSFIMALFNALMKTEQDQKKQKYVGNSFLDGPDPDDASGLVKGTENITHDRRPNAQADLGSTTSKSTCPTTLFESRVTSQFKYSSCRHTENVDDQLFYSFLLPAAVDVKSIDEGLDLYFKSEEFPDNVLQCRECSTQDESTITTRTLLMSAAPDTLMIQLARFSEVSSVDSHYKELEKTNHPVKFGEILTIKKAYTMNERELKYELYGVVLHIGNMHGGHYTSCVRNLKSRKWYFCNDSSVSEMPENAVLQPRNFRNAYLLFYSKKK